MIDGNMSRAKHGVSSGRMVLVKNTWALAAMQVGKYLFPLITLPYLARVLGPDAYAVRAYVVSFMVFMTTIIDYGFSQYGTRAVAERSEDIDYISRVNAVVYVAKFAMLCIAGIITATVTPFIQIMAGYPVFVVVSLLSVALKSFLPDFILQGIQDMKAIAVRFTATQLVAVIMIFLFIRGEEQLLLVPVFEGIAAVISIVWSQVYLSSRFGIGVRRFSFKEFRTIFSESTPFFFAIAASAFMASTITVLMGVFAIDTLTISCWSITATIIQGIQALWQPLSRSLFPYMVVNKDAKLLARLLCLGAPLTVVLVAVCYFGADLIMLVMGGADYVQGAYILQWVSPVILFSYPISMMGYPVIGAIGKASQLSICIITTACIQIVVLLTAGVTGNFNIQAIALARVGSEAVLCALEGVMAFRTMRSIKAGSR